MKTVRLLLAAVALATGFVLFTPGTANAGLLSGVTAPAANECNPYLGPELFGIRCVVDANGVVGAAFTPTVIVGDVVRADVGGGVCTNTQSPSVWCLHYLAGVSASGDTNAEICYGQIYGSYTCVIRY